MIYYSKKYADRQKHLREVALEKAKDLIKNPEKYTQATSYGCTKYINNKFHLTQLISRSLNKTRIMVMKSIKSIIENLKNIGD